MKQNTIILLLAVVGICVCGGIWLCQGETGAACGDDCVRRDER